MTDYLSAPLRRVENRCKAIQQIGEARSAIMECQAETAPAADRPAGKDTTADVQALSLTARMVIDRMEEELRLDLYQIAHLVARDIIAPTARESQRPVAWLTSNNYFPPIRSLPPVESVWISLNEVDNDDNRDWWTDFIEVLEERVKEHKVYMAAPDHDNALYVVDEQRFEWAENEGADDMNDEWRPIT